MNAEDNLNKLIENKINDLNKINKDLKNWKMSLERFQKNDFVMYLYFLHFFHKKYNANLLLKELFCPI